MGIVLHVELPLCPPNPTQSIRVLKLETCTLSSNFRIALKSTCPSLSHLPFLSPSTLPILLPAFILSPLDSCHSVSSMDFL